MDTMKRTISRVAAVMALTLGLMSVGGTASVDAANNIPVKIGGSHCYAGGKLTSWKLVVDNSYTSGFITGTSTTVPQLSSGKHQFFVQTWCRYGFVIGAGRSGSANGWIYSSGYQPPITVYLGLFTAG